MNAHTGQMAYIDPGWMDAKTESDGRLRTRRSWWLDDAEIRGWYPDVVEFIDRNGLAVVDQFEEDDDYMMGGAVVTIYEAAA